MNRKGYTLVEVLAVIMILGILMTLAVMGVSKYLSQTKRTVYKDYEASIKSGATNYLIEHSGDIPNVGETLIIDASKLFCEGYIEELEDPIENGKTCLEGSYAVITRKSNAQSNGVDVNMDITYNACLKCKGYESSFCQEDISDTFHLKKDSSCEVD